MGAVKNAYLPKNLGPSPRSNGVWSFAISATHLPMVNALRKIGEHMQTTREPLERFAEYLAETSKKNFSSESTNEGKAWTPRIGKGSRALLVLTGKMRGTVTSATKGVIKLTDSKLIFGIRKSPRALAHNFGRRKVEGARGVSSIPPREFLAFDDSTRDKLIEIVSDWQTEIISRANRRMAAM